MINRSDLIIIGGGASGFFAALQTAEKHKNIRITIIEKSKNVLSKVKVSGGGRCNITNACSVPEEMIVYYPRGGKELLSAFYKFNSEDTVNWFHQKGVSLYKQNDNRMFPVSNSSQSIIDCFLLYIKKYNIQLITETEIVEVLKKNNEFVLTSDTGEVFYSEYLLLATGGSNKPKAYSIPLQFKHTIIPVVPSLFTFNITDAVITQLMGISMPNVVLKIPGTKFSSAGSLLITHWGMSGPAILKLSSYAARYLYENGYEFLFTVNWIGVNSIEEVKITLNKLKIEMARTSVSTISAFSIPSRLWQYFLNKAEIALNKTYAELNKKEINKLAEILLSDKYFAKGKTTFKEEFVTAGGVCLKEVNFKTMESRKAANLFFAGELLDIDGLTGGFNFQAAWTTAFIAAETIAERMKCVN